MPRNFRVVAAPAMALLTMVPLVMEAPPGMAPLVMVPPAMVPTAPSVAVVFFNSILGMVTRLDYLETKVIAVWVLWIVLRQLQSILGPTRRRSSHWLVQYGAKAFYTANAVYSSSSELKIPLSLGCGLLLFLCARGAVTMTAFTLHNGPQRLQSWRLVPWLVYFSSLQWGWFREDRKQLVPTIISFMIVFTGPVFYVLLVKPKTPVLDYETKEFADYMVCMSRSSSLSPFFYGGHPNRMQDGCKYPLVLKDGRKTKIRDVRLPRDCAVDPDIFLSYSFCRLLARRYFGFPCAEDGNTQVRDFVLTELLIDCNRAFTIVEVQLALLHDYFFTNYHTHIPSGLVSVKQAVAAVLCLALLFLARCLPSLFRASREANLNLGDLGILCALAVPVLLIYIVIRQPEYPVLPRYWHPIRDLISSPSNISAVGQFAATRSKSSPPSYWQEKMGQYSVMEDYDRPSPMNAIKAWFKVHVLSQVSYSFIKHHPAAEKDVSVPGRANTTASDPLYNTTDSLRRLIARTIKDINGPPTIGTRSLGSYRVMTQDDLSWTCRQETVTHTILIWHIATCYCDMSPPLEEETPSTGYRKLATTLSRYCAYLVAFLPELLPEHSLTAKVVLQQLLQEPKYILGTTRMSMDAKRSKIQQLQLPGDESSLMTFQKGVRLGRQLEQQPDVSLCWKAMAEFWAEMILYIASSPDNAPVHIQQLAEGGEFVTHLWALLCNAGIVMKRPTEERTPTAA
ncbi:unnamed protein product [Urochloa decumbens]|uniref:DUF4220 domain-containing protein n=1 Tax=Urochloa decumbens TaxID=240449 RepID=A0ABC9B9L2_9POAL